jgi:LacI family transcriptional regulator
MTSARAIPKLKPPVGLKQIAAAAGVSVSTVSMSLTNHPDVSEPTKRRIHQLSRRMGYQRLRRAPGTKPVASTASRPARIGFILVGTRLDKDINQGTLSALTVTASRQGMRLEVFCIDSVDQVVPQRPQLMEFAAGVEAVILTGFVDADLLQALEKSRIPHILLGTVSGDDQIPGGPHGQIIAPDVIAMGALGVSTFINEGHQRIGFIYGSAPRGLWNDRWLRGYRHALADADLPFDPALVCMTHNAPDAGSRAADAFLALRSPPTAWLFPGMWPAPEFIAAMRARGHEVDLRNIIAGGHDQSSHHYGLAGCRRIGCNLEQVADLLLHQLCHLHRSPMPCPTQLLLPFSLINPPGE